MKLSFNETEVYKSINFDNDESKTNWTLVTFILISSVPSTDVIG